MKRHQALQDLSRDHMFALRVAHHIDQAVRRIENGPSLDEATSELIEAWPDDLRWHFREEEEILLPLIARHQPPTELPEVRVMLDDHAFLRDAIERLLLMDAPDAEFVGELGRRLHDHIRHEERVLYPVIEKLLDPSELDELEAASAAFRRTWRSEDRVGPFRTRG